MIHTFLHVFISNDVHTWQFIYHNVWLVQYYPTAIKQLLDMKT